MADDERIRKQVATYKAQRDGLVTQANLKVAELTGAIVALEAALVPEPEAPAEAEAVAPV